MSGPGVTLLDGGMGRQLARMGAPFRQPEWSALALIETPALVEQVHREFAAAGAGVITTNSYALVPFHIGEDRFQEEGPALMRLAGRLAREAANAVTGRKVHVAGSLPPIFGSYEPERFDAARVQDYLSVLVQHLSPFVDVWLGETLSLIAEGEAVRAAVAETGKPFWISFTLADDAAQRNGASPALRSGERVEDAARWAASSGAEALLFNCSKPEVMRAAVDTAGEVFRSSGSTLQIGVYANAFEGEQGESAANEGLHATRGDLNDDAYSRFACSWVDAGATMVGGCCGIGAGHIHQLRRSLTHAVEAAGNS